MQESPRTIEESRLDPRDGVPSRKNLFLLAVMVEGGLAVAAVGLGWLSGCPPLDAIHWTAAGWGWGLTAVLPMIGLAACAWLPWRPLRNLLHVVDDLLVPLFRNCGLLDLAVISLLAGVGEEMLFRGVLQTWLAGTLTNTLGTAGPWIALAAVAVLFGLVHCITPTYAVLAGLMGLYLGWLWIDTHNLLVPIVAHAVYDFIVLVYLVKMRPRQP